MVESHVLPSKKKIYRLKVKGMVLFISNNASGTHKLRNKVCCQTCSFLLWFVCSYLRSSVGPLVGSSLVRRFVRSFRSFVSFVPAFIHS